MMDRITFPPVFRIVWGRYPDGNFGRSAVFRADTPCDLRREVAKSAPISSSFYIEAVAHVHDGEGIECLPIGSNPVNKGRAYTFTSPFLRPAWAGEVHQMQPVIVAGILKMKYGLALMSGFAQQQVRGEACLAPLDRDYAAAVVQSAESILAQYFQGVDNVS